MSNNRVDVPVYVFLQEESQRFKRMHMAVKLGDHSYQRAILELLESHATLLSLMSQQQLEKDTNA